MDRFRPDKYITQGLHTGLLCFVLSYFFGGYPISSWWIHMIYLPYSSGLFHCHRRNLTIIPQPVKLILTEKGKMGTWWHHRMETFSALLTLCEGNPSVTGGFHSQRPATRSFDVFFDLCLNKELCKQPRCRWFETPSRSLWRHCKELTTPKHNKAQIV